MLPVKPTRKEGLTIQDMGGETMLYNTEEKVVHVLNPTAKFLWELCDGKHTIEDMEQKIRKSFTIPSERNVADDIEQILVAFFNKRILQEG